MSDHSPQPSGSGAAAPSQTLTDRVLARVAEARVATYERSKTLRPKRRRQSGSTNAPVADSPTVEEQREVESLKRVFRDLGISYRAYRRRTGEPVVPELRDAAYSFRAEPSVTSLVAVAAFLDDLDLLS